MSPRLARSNPLNIGGPLLPRLAVGGRALATAVGGRALATASFVALAPRGSAPLCTSGPQHGIGLTNTADELTSAFAAPGAVVVDVRTADENAAGPAVPGAVLAPWDRDASTMPIDGLPTDKTSPLLVHWGSGGRASKAKAYLEAQGFTQVLNAGGPRTPELWAAYSAGKA